MARSGRFVTHLPQSPSTDLSRVSLVLVGRSPVFGEQVGVLVEVDRIVGFEVVVLADTGVASSLESRQVAPSPKSIGVELVHPLGWLVVVLETRNRRLEEQRNNQTAGLPVVILTDLNSFLSITQ